MTVARWFDTAKRLSVRGDVRLAAALLAFALFVTGLTISILTNPNLLRDIRLAPALALLLGVFPLIVAGNVAQTLAIARIAGCRFSLSAAFRVTVFSSAANHLPLPGGILLRVGAMTAAGADAKRAAAATLASGFLWISAAFAIAAPFAAMGAPPLAFALAGAALVSGAAGLYLAFRLRRRFLDLLSLLGLNLLCAVTYALAVFVALAALGAADAGVALVVSAAGVIGNAVSLAPAGLGVREAAAAGLAALIGAEPATAFLSTTLVHAAAMAHYAVISLWLANPLAGRMRFIGR
jgi:hypothetical protein